MLRTKINPKWVKGFKVKPEVLNCLRKPWLQDTEIGKDFAKGTWVAVNEFMWPKGTEPLDLGEE